MNHELKQEILRLCETKEVRRPQKNFYEIYQEPLSIQMRAYDPSDYELIVKRNENCIYFNCVNGYFSREPDANGRDLFEIYTAMKKKSKQRTHMDPVCKTSSEILAEIRTVFGTAKTK